MGQKEASDAALKDLIAKYANIAAYQIAEAYAYRGEKEKAFDGLTAPTVNATQEWSVSASILCWQDIEDDPAMRPCCGS